MKIQWNLLAVFAIVFSVLSVRGGELGRNDFKNAGGAAGWEMKNLGDGKARVLNPSGQPLLLAAPTAQSWLYAVRNFSPQELGDARKIRFTAWVCSNRPDQVQYAISEGAPWGEAIDRVARVTGRQALVWEPITVELERTGPDGMVSVAFGLDYFREGVWVAIDRVKIETARAGEAFPPVDGTPPTQPYVLPGDAAAWFAVGADPDTLVWQTTGELTAFNADTELTAENSESVRIDAPRNARGSAVVLIANRSDAVQSLQWKLSPDLADKIELARFASIENTPDFPVRLEPGAIVEIGWKQCIGIELAVETGDIPAGTYRGTLEMIPLDGRLPVRSLAVELVIWPVELPAVMPIAIFNWDYGWSRDPARRDFLLRARTNVFQVPFWDRAAAERFDGLDEIVAGLTAKLPRGQFQLLIELWHVREQGAWLPADSAWLDRLVQRMEGLGLDYSDWMLQIYDETLSDEFYKAARAIKDHNPRVRIFSDYLGRDPAVAERFAGVVDLWCPFAGVLPPAQQGYDAALAAIRATGLPIWSYTCDASPQHKLSLYRLQGWQSWQLGLDGTGFWTCKNSEFRPRPGTPNFGMTYLDGDGRMLASRRWNQWRAGLEDYLLLHLAAADPGRKALAERLAAEVLNASGDPSAAMNSARRQLLEALSAPEARP